MGWGQSLEDGTDRVVNFVTFGTLDRYDAKNITKKASNKKNNIKKELDATKTNTQKDIKNLGKLKETTYDQSISKFVELYEIVGKADLKPLKKSETLNYKNFRTDFKEIQATTTSLKELSTAIGGGAVVGTTAVFGAIGTAALIGTASTGTVIGTLSGAAFTNATLAWLGGGTIAAGGAGVTGGMVVLGGIAIAPVAIFGMFLGTNKGKQALNEAKNYSDEIDVLVEKVVTLIAELSQIRRGCFLMSETIIGLDALMKAHNTQMDKIAYRLEHRSSMSKKFIDPIKNKIFNIDILTEQEAETFAASANTASMLSKIIKIPLMNEKGAFISDSLNILEANKEEIAKIQLQSNKQGQKK